MNHKEAHFFHRLLANTIDNSIYLAINLYVINIVIRSTDIPSLVANLFLLLLVFISPIGILHIVLFTQWFGGTLGKLLTGIKVTSVDGTPLSFKRILFRQTIGYTFSSLLFGVGYLAILKNTRRQAWHDQAVGSLVVKTGNFWLLGLLVCLTMAGAITYFGAQTVKTALANEPLKQSFMSLYHQIQEERQPGTLQINSEPKSNITINGEDKGSTPFEDKNLKPGDYKITLKSDDKNSVNWEGIATVNKNTITFVYRDLKKEIMAGEIITLETGKGLKVTSNPSEANISIDGKDLGKTPFIKEDLSLGEHEVILEKTGSLGRVIKISVVENYQTHLTMDLGQDTTPALQTKPITVKKVTAEQQAETVKYWEDELIYINQEIANLPIWKSSDKDQTKIDRMIAITNEQKAFATKALAKSKNGDTFTLEEGEQAKKYAQLTEEYNKLLNEVFPR